MMSSDDWDALEQLAFRSECHQRPLWGSGQPAREVAAAGRAAWYRLLTKLLRKLELRHSRLRHLKFGRHETTYVTVVRERVSAIIVKKKRITPVLSGPVVAPERVQHPQQKLARPGKQCRQIGCTVIAARNSSASKDHVPMCKGCWIDHSAKTAKLLKDPSSDLSVFQKVEAERHELQDRLQRAELMVERLQDELAENEVIYKRLQKKAGVEILDRTGFMLKSHKTVNRKLGEVFIVSNDQDTEMCTCGRNAQLPTPPGDRAPNQKYCACCYVSLASPKAIRCQRCEQGRRIALKASKGEATHIIA